MDRDTAAATFQFNLMGQSEEGMDSTDPSSYCVETILHEPGEVGIQGFKRPYCKICTKSRQSHVRSSSPIARCGWHGPGDDGGDGGSVERGDERHPPVLESQLPPTTVNSTFS
jgi:hypothetical protein